MPGLSNFLLTRPGFTILYNEGRKWFTIISALTAPVLFFVDPPFGRFTPSNQSSIFILDGLKSWICMELVSPIVFIYAFLSSPLSEHQPAISEPQSILAACYVIHYLNRSLLGPLRTPSRSKTHISVPLSGAVFNVINGGLMGAYLSSPSSRDYHTIRTPMFYVGLALWAVGLAGNIYHDEILLNIRRKAKSKGKASEQSSSSKGEYYAIPEGGLYSLISYPSYFCEWVEWFGFACAAAPLPFLLTGVSPSSMLDKKTYLDILYIPANLFAPSLSPPWIFLFNEIILMLPQAYRKHQWYLRKFGEAYPKKRKAVIPFLL